MTGPIDPVTETINTVLGYACDTVLSKQLHDLGHKAAVEYVVIKREDTLRRRLRVHYRQGNGMPDSAAP